MSQLFLDDDGDGLRVDSSYLDKGRITISAESTSGYHDRLEYAVDYNAKQTRALANLLTILANIMEGNEK